MNDKTIIELGSRKISWFIGGSHSQVSYLPLICLRHRLLIDLLTTDKSRRFAQPRPIINHARREFTLWNLDRILLWPDRPACWRYECIWISIYTHEPALTRRMWYNAGLENLHFAWISDKQARAEGESLYIWYNTAAHVVNVTTVMSLSITLKCHFDMYVFIDIDYCDKVTCVHT